MSARVDGYRREGAGEAETSTPEVFALRDVAKVTDLQPALTSVRPEFVKVAGGILPAVDVPPGSLLVAQRARGFECRRATGGNPACDRGDTAEYEGDDHERERIRGLHPHEQ